MSLQAHLTSGGLWIKIQELESMNYEWYYHSKQGVLLEFLIRKFRVHFYFWGEENNFFVFNFENFLNWPYFAGFQDLIENATRREGANLKRVEEERPTPKTIWTFHWIVGWHRLNFWL